MTKIEHDRQNCIGCGACVAVHPQGWIMASDGKSDIKDSIMRKDGWEEKEVNGPDEKLHHEAALSCPVSVIHITKDGKKIL